MLQSRPLCLENCIAFVIWSTGSFLRRNGKMDWKTYRWNWLRRNSRFIITQQWKHLRWAGIVSQCHGQGQGSFSRYSKDEGWRIVANASYSAYTWNNSWGKGIDTSFLWSLARCIKINICMLLNQAILPTPSCMWSVFILNYYSY